MPLKLAMAYSKIFWLVALAVPGIFASYFWGSELITFVTPRYDGLIIVNSPTIYTRQRLVNDRLSQTAWLKGELEVTRAGTELFRSIDIVSDGSRQNTSTLSIGNSSAQSGEQSKSSGEQPKPSKSSENPVPKSADSAPTSSKPMRTETTGAMGVVPTTADLFRAKNAYRDEVRSEMMEAQLDDRHDIDGNTIYRLAFGATVLPGTSKDKLAVVKVTLSHDPDQNREPEIAAEYDKLYEDWLRSMRRTVEKSIDPISDKIDRRQLDAGLTTSLPRFVLKRICEIVFDLKKIRFRPSRCVSDEDKPMLELKQTSKAINRFAEEYVKSRKKILESIGKSNIDRAVRKAKKDPGSFKFLDGSLERWCDPEVIARFRPTGPTTDLGKPDDTKIPAAIGKKMPAATGKKEPPPSPTANQPVLPSISGQIVEIRDIVSDARIEVECPIFDPPAEKIIGALYLYYKLFTYKPSDGRPEKLNGETLDIVVGRFIDDLKCSEKNLANCSLPSLTRAERRCVAADYMLEYLDFFGEPLPARLPLSSYLELALLGPEAGNCSILIDAKTPAYDTKRGPDILRDKLNEGTEVYSYAVTPKNLVQRISTALETRDTIQALLRAEGQDLTSALESLRQKSNFNRAIEANPIVVGFGLATDSRPPVENVKTTEFGWLIAPQMRVDQMSNDRREQVDEQYGLSAVVSVPAWWRAVRLVIKTCWISRSKLHLYGNRREICTKDEDVSDNTEKHSSTIVRLPVSIEEISHKLAFEVVQEPYLTQSTTAQTPFVVMVGQPAELILRGSRLWRSTEVTLGSQRADEIVVLPDMKGIVARFKCVKRQMPLDILVKVFTSEGEADPEYARLTEPPDAQPCPEVLRDLEISAVGKREIAPISTTTKPDPSVTSPIAATAPVPPGRPAPGKSHP